MTGVYSIISEEQCLTFDPESSPVIFIRGRDDLNRYPPSTVCGQAYPHEPRLPSDIGHGQRNIITGNAGSDIRYARQPPLPPWTPPPETRLTGLEWQSLRTLDLSLLDGSPEEQRICQETCAAAVQNEGFLLIKNFGVGPEEVRSRFDRDMR